MKSVQIFYDLFVALVEYHLAYDCLLYTSDAADE